MNTTIDISSFTKEEIKNKIGTLEQPKEPIVIEAPETPTPGEQPPQRLEIPAPVTTQEINLNPATVGAPTAEVKKEPAANAAPEISEEELKKMSERNANMFVNLVDLVVSRLCSVLSGEEPERYKLHKLEKEEYKEATAAYFVTLKTQISPALVFFASTITIFSGILLKAWGDRKKKIKASEQEKELKAAAEAERRAAAAARKAATANEQQATTERPETIVKDLNAVNKEVRKKPVIYKEEVPEAKEERSNFEIYTEDDKPSGISTKWNDSLIGYYKRTADNERLTYEECIKIGTKPSPLLNRLINAELMKGKEWRIINKELRKYIKSLPSFDDE